MIPFTTRSRGGAFLALAPVALLMFAACTSGPAATPSADPSGGIVTSGPLAPPTDGAPTQPNLVTPEPVKNAHKQAFIRAEAVPGKSAVRVEGTLMTGPPCNVIGRAELVETNTQVTITLWAGARPDAKCDGPQATVQYPFAIEVPLKEPLGERAVIDGAL